jgi:hypothetical protein
MVRGSRATFIPIVTIIPIIPIISVVSMASMMVRRLIMRHMLFTLRFTTLSSGNCVGGYVLLVAVQVLLKQVA